MQLYRMSEAGKCPRMLWAKETGVKGADRPAWLDDAAEEGKAQEGIVKNKLRKLGWTVIEEGTCQICPGERQGIHVELKTDKFTLLGHMDGKVQKDGETHLLEVKTMSEYEYGRWMKGGWEEFPDYAVQITCYMYATGIFTALYCVKNRNSGQMIPFVQSGPPADIDMIMQKFDALTGMIQLGNMPAEEADFTTFRCKRCSHKHLCVKSKDAMIVQDETALTAAAIDWRKGDALIAEGQKLIDAAKEVFMEQTIASGEKKWSYNGLLINLIQKRFEMYDKKILLTLFKPDKLAPALKVKESEYITITDNEKEK